MLEMDKFLIRSKGPLPSTSNPSSATDRSLKQSTIESLKVGFRIIAKSFNERGVNDCIMDKDEPTGIVVVEDVLRAKQVIKTQGQCPQLVLKELSQLEKKIPSRQVLQQTKIGHTLKDLRKHGNIDISRKATSILRTWKIHYRNKLTQPVCDVKCDTHTEKLREIGRKQLMERLEKSVETAPTEVNTRLLSQTIEREVFFQCNRRATSAYKRTVRALVFALDNQSDLRQSVLSQTRPVQHLVTAYKKPGLGQSG